MSAQPNITENVGNHPNHPNSNPPFATRLQSLHPSSKITHNSYNGPNASAFQNDQSSEFKGAVIGPGSTIMSGSFNGNDGAGNGNEMPFDLDNLFAQISRMRGSGFSGNTAGGPTSNSGAPPSTNASTGDNPSATSTAPTASAPAQPLNDNHRPRRSRGKGVRSLRWMNCVQDFS
ncbi:hypothetical protein CPB83DRAFT_860980 [Crepidotus variabilis]|uniref:Uncharacterized protein n=1 Tax=Crepidotus variabilis TaxID=179855 RepID=A0A9P6E8W0_9AGAR|nr:hypothetical protein CPB83DRAFT_860980 [Crepidotus variabilis]